ncbi:hypothetical protein AAFF_G00358740 [Aldrovandia affinis]|uniref:Reverse transcriptase domain-containing protein n=1 Tax=Aldrovandia affinis TaxID=143900 RepID=A0AAD7TAI5_9TELE|nr:hypothetical protein AAFF_G00358740 [Aldrovandia affinis]
MVCSPISSCDKLSQLKVDPTIHLWILDFRLNQEQYGKLNNSRSLPLSTSTGVSQGTVISPVVFSIYANDLWGSGRDCLAVKYADNTALVDLSESASYFKSEVSRVYNWCNSNLLQLNIKQNKTL